MQLTGLQQGEGQQQHEQHYYLDRAGPGATAAAAAGGEDDEDGDIFYPGPDAVAANPWEEEQPQQ